MLHSIIIATSPGAVAASVTACPSASLGILLPAASSILRPTSSTFLRRHRPAIVQSSSLHPSYASHAFFSTSPSARVDVRPTQEGESPAESKPLPIKRARGRPRKVSRDNVTDTALTKESDIHAAVNFAESGPGLSRLSTPDIPPAVQSAKRKGQRKDIISSRRQEILSATRPPPYKSRASSVQTGDLLPLYLRPKDEQLEIPSDYHWSHLPAPEHWHCSSLAHEKSGFLGKHRYFLSNRVSVKQLVDLIGLDEISRQNNGGKVTVVEAFAGPGTLTSELLGRDEVGKVLAMEQEKAFLPWLKGLFVDPTQTDPSGVRPDKKLTIVERAGFHWDTYEAIDAAGLLSHLQPVLDMTDEQATKLAPLVFIAQLPNSVHGDQLLAQLTAAASGSQWLYRYGRVKLVFICPENMTTRFLAPASSPERSRLGTLLSILHKTKVLCHHEDYFYPQGNHLFPPNMTAGKRSLAVSTISNEHIGSGLPFEELCASEFVPRISRVMSWRGVAAKSEAVEERAAQQNETADDEVSALIGDEYESLEYLLRNLFVARTRNLLVSMERTYPGSSLILKKLTPEAIEAYEIKKGMQKGDSGLVPIDPAKRPVDLTNAEWISLAQMFERWPFRPNYLFEQSIETRPPACEPKTAFFDANGEISTVASMGLTDV